MLCNSKTLSNPPSPMPPNPGMNPVIVLTSLGSITTKTAPMIEPLMVARPPMKTTARKSIDRKMFQVSGEMRPITMESRAPEMPA